MAQFFQLFNYSQFYTNLLKRNEWANTKKRAFYYMERESRTNHVHIKNKREVCQWDLDNNQIMEGKVNRKILKALQELIKEGKLK